MIDEALVEALLSDLSKLTVTENLDLTHLQQIHFDMPISYMREVSLEGAFLHTCAVAEFMAGLTNVLRSIYTHIDLRCNAIPYLCLGANSDECDLAYLDFHWLISADVPLVNVTPDMWLAILRSSENRFQIVHFGTVTMAYELALFSTLYGEPIIRSPFIPDSIDDVIEF